MPSEAPPEPPEAWRDPDKPYRDLMDFYRRTFRTEDTAPLDVCLATVLTAKWDGDPLWFFLVAPPSSGKTAILQGFQKDADGTIFRNTLTPHALVSGLKREQKDLLPRLDGKCLIVKDFTTILQTRRESRDEIIGDLRAIFDGDFSKSFGSDVGDKEYVAHFNLLAAVTNVIELHYSVDSVVGQRLLMVRMELPKDFDSDAEREPKAVKSEFQEKVLALLRERRSFPFDPELTDDQVRECKRLADEAGTLRTEVPRDQKGDLKMMPAKEGGARLTNQFEKVACGVAFTRGHSEVLNEDMEIVRRVARDTVPSVRREVIASLVGGASTASEIRMITGLGDWEVRRKLSDLHVLKVLSVKEEAQVQFYEMHGDFLLFRSPVDKEETTSPSPTEPEPAFAIPIFYHGKEAVVRNATGELVPPKRLHDEIAWRVRNHPDAPATFVRKEIALALQVPEDAGTNAIIEGYAEAVRASLTWTEWTGSSP